MSVVTSFAPVPVHEHPLAFPQHCAATPKPAFRRCYSFALTCTAADGERMDRICCGLLAERGLSDAFLVPSEPEMCEGGCRVIKATGQIRVPEDVSETWVRSVVREVEATLPPDVQVDLENSDLE